MEGMSLKFTPVIGRRLLHAIQACLGLWLTLLRPIASPNTPNQGFNLSLASHPPPTPAHPYNVPSVILQWF